MDQQSKELLTKAFALLDDAAGMLRMEANEWRSRRNDPPKSWLSSSDAKAWAIKCERVAEINISAATSMARTSDRIAEHVRKAA